MEKFRMPAAGGAALDRRAKQCEYGNFGHRRPSPNDVHIRRNRAQSARHVTLTTGISRSYNCCSTPISAAWSGKEASISVVIPNPSIGSYDRVIPSKSYDHSGPSRPATRIR